MDQTSKQQWSSSGSLTRKLKGDWWKAKLCTACVSPLGRILSRGGHCPQCGLRVCKNCRIYDVTSASPATATSTTSKAGGNSQQSPNSAGAGTQKPLWICVLCSGSTPNFSGSGTIPKSSSIGKSMAKSIRRSWTISNPQRTTGAQTDSPVLKSYVIYNDDTMTGTTTTALHTPPTHMSNARQFNSLPRLSYGISVHDENQPAMDATGRRFSYSTLYTFQKNNRTASNSSVNFIEEPFWDYYDYNIINSNRSSCERSLGEIEYCSYIIDPTEETPKKKKSSVHKSNSESRKNGAINQNQNPAHHSQNGGVHPNNKRSNSLNSYDGRKLSFSPLRTYVVLRQQQNQHQSQPTKKRSSSFNLDYCGGKRNRAAPDEEYPPPPDKSELLRPCSEQQLNCFINRSASGYSSLPKNPRSKNPRSSQDPGQPGSTDRTIRSLEGGRPSQAFHSLPKRKSEELRSVPPPEGKLSGGGHYHPPQDRNAESSPSTSSPLHKQFKYGSDPHSSSTAPKIKKPPRKFLTSDVQSLPKENNYPHSHHLELRPRGGSSHPLGKSNSFQEFSSSSSTPSHPQQLPNGRRSLGKSKSFQLPSYPSELGRPHPFQEEVRKFQEEIRKFQSPESQPHFSDDTSRYFHERFLKKLQDSRGDGDNPNRTFQENIRLLFQDTPPLRSPGKASKGSAFFPDKIQNHPEIDPKLEDLIRKSEKILNPSSLHSPKSPLLCSPWADDDTRNHPQRGPHVIQVLQINSETFPRRKHLTTVPVLEDTPSTHSLDRKYPRNILRIQKTPSSPSSSSEDFAQVEEVFSALDEDSSGSDPEVKGSGSLQTKPESFPPLASGKSSIQTLNQRAVQTPSGASPQNPTQKTPDTLILSQNSDRNGNGIKRLNGDSVFNGDQNNANGGNCALKSAFKIGGDPKGDSAFNDDRSFKGDGGSNGDKGVHGGNGPNGDRRVNAGNGSNGDKRVNSGNDNNPSNSGKDVKDGNSANSGNCLKGDNSANSGNCLKGDNSANSGNCLKGDNSANSGKCVNGGKCLQKGDNPPKMCESAKFDTDSNGGSFAESEGEMGGGQEGERTKMLRNVGEKESGGANNGNVTVVEGGWVFNKAPSWSSMPGAEELLGVSCEDKKNNNKKGVEDEVDSGDYPHHEPPSLLGTSQDPKEQQQGVGPSSRNSNSQGKSSCVSRNQERQEEQVCTNARRPSSSSSSSSLSATHSYLGNTTTTTNTPIFPSSSHTKNNNNSNSNNNTHNNRLTDLNSQYGNPRELLRKDLLYPDSPRPPASGGPSRIVRGRNSNEFVTTVHINQDMCHVPLVVNPILRIYHHHLHQNNNNRTGEIDVSDPSKSQRNQFQSAQNNAKGINIVKGGDSKNCGVSVDNSGVITKGKGGVNNTGVSVREGDVNNSFGVNTGDIDRGSNQAGSNHFPSDQNVTKSRNKGQCDVNLGRSNNNSGINLDGVNNAGSVNIDKSGIVINNNGEIGSDSTNGCSSVSGVINSPDSIDKKSGRNKSGSLLSNDAFANNGDGSKTGGINVNAQLQKNGVEIRRGNIPVVIDGRISDPASRNSKHRDIERAISHPFHPAPDPLESGSDSVQNSDLLKFLGQQGLLIKKEGRTASQGLARHQKGDADSTGDRRVLIGGDQGANTEVLVETCDLCNESEYHTNCNLIGGVVNHQKKLKFREDSHTLHSQEGETQDTHKCNSRCQDEQVLPKRDQEHNEIYSSAQTPYNEVDEIKEQVSPRNECAQTTNQKNSRANPGQQTDCVDQIQAKIAQNSLIPIIEKERQVVNSTTVLDVLEKTNVVQHCRENSTSSDDTVIDFFKVNNSSCATSGGYQEGLKDNEEINSSWSQRALISCDCDKRSPGSHYESSNYSRRSDNNLVGVDQEISNPLCSSCNSSSQDSDNHKSALHNQSSSRDQTRFSDINRADNTSANNPQQVINAKEQQQQGSASTGISNPVHPVAEKIKKLIFGATNERPIVPIINNDISQLEVEVQALSQLTAHSREEVEACKNISSNYSETSETSSLSGIVQQNPPSNAPSVISESDAESEILTNQSGITDEANPIPHILDLYEKEIFCDRSIIPGGRLGSSKTSTENLLQFLHHLEKKAEELGSPSSSPSAANTPSPVHMTLLNQNMMEHHERLTPEGQESFTDESYSSTVNSAATHKRSSPDGEEIQSAKINKLEEETFQVTSSSSDSDNSWIEEVPYEEGPPPLDLTLHTIVEESCEDSESEKSLTFPTATVVRNNNKNALENYFNYLDPQQQQGAENGIMAVVNPRKGSTSAGNEDSEFSDTFSESSFNSEVIQPHPDDDDSMDPADLASSRLEKYFTNLSSYHQRNLHLPHNHHHHPVVEQDSEDSVGSESENDDQIKDKKKKVLKHKRSANVSDDESIFDQDEGAFDTIKKPSKKKETAISPSDPSNTITGSNSNSKHPQVPQSEANAKVSELEEGQEGRNGDEDTSEMDTSSKPTKQVLLDRSNSFQWSSDEEVNLMMSKLRHLIKNLMHKSASTPSETNSQLRYFETELIRLMRAEPELKNIVSEYISSEESDDNEFNQFIKDVVTQQGDPFDCSSANPGKGSGFSYGGMGNSMGIMKGSSNNILGTPTSSGTSWGGAANNPSPAGNNINAGSSNSPALIAKVMHHIGNRLSVWMKDEEEEQDGSLKCAPSVSSDLNEDRFSWKGSFESTLAAKRQSVGSTDSISSSDFNSNQQSHSAGAGVDRSILRSSSLHHLANSQPIEEKREEEENISNSLPKLNQVSHMPRAQSLIGIKEKVKSARYRPPGFTQPSSIIKQIDDKMSMSTPVLHQDNVIHPETPLNLRSSADSISSMFEHTGGRIHIRGQVEFSLQYNYKLASLEVRVKQCRDLAAVDLKRNRTDPYVKAYLLPDRTKGGKRKTKTKKNTLNPIFEETLKFPLSLSELQSRTLWISVWHNDIFGKNEFLGQILLPLKDRVFDDPNPTWWSLEDMSVQVDDQPRGDLIIALKWLPRTQNTGNLSVLVKEAKNLLPCKNGCPSTFVKCSPLKDVKNHRSKQKTSIARRTLHPIWNQTLYFEDIPDDGVEISLWNHDLLSNHDLIGSIRLDQDHCLWESMLNRHSFWVEGGLKLDVPPLA